MNESSFISRFENMPIIGIVRNEKAANVPYIIESSIKAGLQTVEVTINSPSAEIIISNAIKKFGNEIIIGAGTVRNDEDLMAAINSGAEFIVTPNLDPTTVSKCVELELAIIPGVFTPTEVDTALGLGAQMLKVFPAKVLGPYFFKSIQEPFGKLKLIATGGISLDNLSAYRDAGAYGFGIGGRLFPEEFIENANWKGLEHHIKQFAEQAKL